MQILFVIRFILAGLALAVLPSCESKLKVTTDGARERALVDQGQAGKYLLGSFDYCLSEGQTDCVATQAYPAIAVKEIASNLLIGQQLLGVKGQAPLPELLPCEQEGQLACYIDNQFTAAQIEGLAEKVSAGESVAGVAGNVLNHPNICAVDGQTICLAQRGDFMAIDTTHIQANEILKTVTLAGIAGTLKQRPTDCLVNASVDCVTSAGVPAADRSQASSHLYKIRNSVTVLSILTGTLADCESDGESNCLSDGASTRAADLTHFSNADLRLSVLAAGLTGVAAAIPADCSSDGQGGCKSIAAFPAIDKVSTLTPLRSKYSSSLTIGGVSGLMNDCASEGVEGCSTVSNFPAVDKSVKLTAGASSIRSNLTLAGVTGALSNCSSDGSSSCFAEGTVTKAARLANFTAADIKSGLSIASVSGTLILIPGNCGSDAQMNCVTISNYPALDKINNLQNGASKVRSNLTIQTKTGSMPNCAVDGATACYSVANFPSIDITNLTSKASSLRTSYSVAGIAGTLSDCSSNGAGTCFVDGTNTKAQDPASLSAASIRSGTTILGVSGSFADCSSNGQQNCYASGSYYGMPACSSDGQNDCYAMGLYFAATSCAASGSTCFVPSYAAGSQPLKAINYDDITSDKIKSGATISDVIGNYPSNTYPLPGSDATDDLTSGNFASKMFSSSTFAWFDKTGQRRTGGGTSNLVASSIKNGVSIFGVTGTLKVPAAIDIRAGISVGSGSGTLKSNCRNAASSAYNYDGVVSSISNTLVTSGTTFDWWDTIDDWNRPTTLPAGWATSLYSCDRNNWSIESTTCTSSKCWLKDNLAGLIWSQWLGSGTSFTWNAAVQACAALASTDSLPWRMPTQKEWLDALVHGFNDAAAANTNFSQGTSANRHFWTGTTSATDTTRAWKIGIRNLYSTPIDSKTSTYTVHCVR